MSIVVRSAFLGLLLSGAAFSAYAQSDNVASLPPAAATPPAATAAAPLGPVAADPAANTGDPRDLWATPEVQAQAGPAPYNSR
jgi:hypothetical protein